MNNNTNHQLTEVASTGFKSRMLQASFIQPGDVITDVGRVRGIWYQNGEVIFMFTSGAEDLVVKNRDLVEVEYDGCYS